MDRNVPSAREQIEGFLQRYEDWGRQVEASEFLGLGESAVNGVEVRYSIRRLPDNLRHQGCYVSPDGDITVDEIISAPESLRGRFQDLMAYHEVVEYGLHQDSRIPFPRGRLEGEQLEIARLFHEQAHFLELAAAQNVGILKEYLEWRPREGCTKEFVRRLDPDLAEKLYNTRRQQA